MKRLLRYLAILVIALVALAGILFAFGARIVLDGGGRLHVRFIESSSEREQAVERHRESQRATAPIVPAAAPGQSGAGPVAPGTAAMPVPAEPAAVAAAFDWIDYRGPNRDGHYRGRILTTWPSSGLRSLWKQPVGEGYASFVVAGGRAFTIEQRGEREVVAAYDVASGRELWANSWTAAFREFMGGDGPRATPVWADGLVYALGGEGELRCLDDATGRVVWRTNILADAGASNLQWGMAASPLIVDNTVVALPGGSGGKSVVAYDRRTGARAWSALDDQSAYASPMLVTLAGVRQILVFGATRLMGLSPTDGAFLWEYPWRTQYDMNAAQPLVIGENRVFLSSGYGTGAAVVEITGPARRLRSVKSGATSG